MNRAEKIQRLEATLVRVLARKDITRIRNVPSVPVVTSPGAAKGHVGIEAFMGPPVQIQGDDLSEVPTSVIRMREESPSVPPAPEPAFRIEGRPAAKAPEPEPVVAKAPSLVPEPEPPPVRSVPPVSLAPEPSIARAPTPVPEPEPESAPEVTLAPTSDEEILLEDSEDLELDVTEEPAARTPTVIPSVPPSAPQPVIEPVIEPAAATIPPLVEPESLRPPPSLAPAAVAAPAVAEALRAEVFAPAPLPAIEVAPVAAPVAVERPRTLRGMIERALTLRPRR